MVSPTLISESYRALSAEKHRTGPGYGTSGRDWALYVEKLCDVYRAETLLDYGCGKGTLKTALGANRPYRIEEYDPAISGKDEPPAPADVVVCGDVLEHVEPECLEAVLDDLQRLALRAVFLVIHNGPAFKTLPDGRNTHLTIEPVWWWMPKIASRWKIKEFSGNYKEFVCIATKPEDTP